MEHAENVATLALLTRDGAITLGTRKTGRWIGVLNGPGGKREKGETIAECVAREVREEFGLRLGYEAYGAPIALINFYAAGRLHFQVYVFRVDGFRGDPLETDSMCPEAHPLDAIPYDRMMEGDRHWFPLALAATAENPLMITVRYREPGVGLIDEPTVEPWE